MGQLRGLWTSHPYRRLVVLRLFSQFGDGVFQAALAGLFFFSPENGTTPGRIAAGFAVMLAPFTLIGPWAGVLLDRWPRRSVLVWGSAVRALLAVGVGLAMVGAAPSIWIYAAGLACLSVNRFLLAGLGASLPLTVPADALLTANAITPTLGTAAAGLGGVAGLTGVGLIGTERTWLVPLVAATVFAAAGLVARGFPRGLLGPAVVSGSLVAALRSLMRGLADAASYLVRRRTPAAALAIVGGTRLCFGLMFVAAILISRNLLGDPAQAGGGLLDFVGLAGATAIGFALAAILSPLAHQRLSPRVWIVCCLGTAAASQVALAISAWRPVLVGAAMVLGLGIQGSKIAVDTIIQRDTDDAVRGRAFALYDVTYNVAFVGAAAIAAVVLPPTGYAPVVFAVLALAYGGLAMVALAGPAAAAAATVPGRSDGPTG